MKRDSVTDIKVVNSIKPTTLTASANGASVDTLGFMGVAIALSLAAATGMSGVNNVVFKLQESDDNAAWADVDASVAADNLDGSSDYVPGHGVVTIDDDAETDQAYRIGYRGYSRYVRVVATVAGTVSMISAAVVILSDAEITPAAQTV